MELNPSDLFAEAQTLASTAQDEIATAPDTAALEAIHVRYLGRKSRLGELLSLIGQLPAEARAQAGARFNVARKAIEEALAAKLAETGAKPVSAPPGVDLTLPGIKPPLGKRHPLYRTMDEIVEIFEGLGFTVALGPEIEDELHNFDSLNFPPNHPSRDLQDTLYLPGGFLLRTHTSPVQVRTMLAEKPPIRIVAPGRTYRMDAIDATHYPIFHQVEGLWVDENVSLADLKGLLYEFFRRLYGMTVKIRFRPSFFPFTEPSAEVDMACLACQGAGCESCGQQGYLEMLGCGMVHPNVFRAVGIDAEKYTGMAFGMGVDRSTMRRYNLPDIRLLWENDLRLLKQF